MGKWENAEKGRAVKETTKLPFFPFAFLPLPPSLAPDSHPLIGQFERWRTVRASGSNDLPYQELEQIAESFQDNLIARSALRTSRNASSNSSRE